MADEIVVTKDSAEIYEHHLMDSTPDNPPAKEHPADDSTPLEHPETQPPEYIFTLDDGTGVTTEDAKKGYLRQSDYTKKQQQISKEREEVEYLRTAIGKALPHIQKALPEIYDYLTTPDAVFPEEFNISDDPTQQELHLIKRQLEDIRMNEQRKELIGKLNSGFDKIKSDFDKNFSEDEKNSVLNFMKTNNVGDPIVAYKAMNHDKIVAQVKKDAIAEAEAKRKQAEKEALANPKSGDDTKNITEIPRNAPLDVKVKAYEQYFK